MKTITKILICLCLVGCGEGYNVAKCRQGIVDEFHTSEVVAVPGERWKWIVRSQDNEIWYVETLGDQPKVTAKTILFSAK